MSGSWRRTGGLDPHLENHKAIGFLRNTATDHLENQLVPLGGRRGPYACAGPEFFCQRGSNFDVLVFVLF